MLGKALIAAGGVALALGATPASALAPVPGGCASIDTDAGCGILKPHYKGDFDGYSESLAVSPDGRHAYFVYGGNNQTGLGRIGRASVLYAIRRDPSTGAVEQVPGRRGCASARPNPRCATARGLDTAWQVAVSEDGRFVYVASYNSRGVAIFRRNATTGTITQLPGRNGCLRGRTRRKPFERCRFLARPLDSATSIRLVPGGRLAYVDGVAFRRSPSSGLLSPATTALKPADGGKESSVLSRDGDRPYVFSADGRFAYEPLDLGVHVYAIDARSGRLTRVQCAACDIEHTNYFAFTLAADGRFAYVAAEGKIQAYVVDPQSGKLSATGAPVASCALADGTKLACNSTTEDLAISTDGRSLYAAGSLEIVELARDPQTGAISPLPSPSCAGNFPACGSVTWLGDLYDMLATPDGGLLLHVGGGVFSLRR